MPQPKKIFMGSDHAGYRLKTALVSVLSKEFPKLDFEDVGCYNEAPVDYPVYAKAVAEKAAANIGLGILICGTGIGQAIAANKISGVRAAAVSDTTSARLSREHNDANVLCIGARILGSEQALDICRIWLRSEFQGGRHEQRLRLITELEK